MGKARWGPFCFNVRGGWAPPASPWLRPWLRPHSGFFLASATYVKAYRKYSCHLFYMKSQEATNGGGMPRKENWLQAWSPSKGFSRACPSAAGWRCSQILVASLIRADIRSMQCVHSRTAGPSRIIQLCNVRSCYNTNSKTHSLTCSSITHWYCLTKNPDPDFT